MPDNSRIIISIDPSLSNAGWAVGKQDNGNLCLLGHGHIRTYSKWEDWQRVQTLREGIKGLIQQYSVNFVLYESPGFFLYSKDRGVGIRSFVGLGMSIGSILSIPGIEYQGISPQEWKGRKTKQETKNMIESILGYEIKDHNEIDAIGLLVWFINPNSIIVDFSNQSR